MTAIPQVQETKSSTGKILAFVGCGCLALVALGVAAVFAIVAVVFGALKKSEAYTESIALVQNHPGAVAALGEPIKPGFMVSGNFSFNNGEGEVDLSIPVSGPTGSGTIRVVGEKPLNQAWQYSVWELVTDDGEVIPLGE